MEKGTNDPFGVESMLKTWGQTMSDMTGTMSQLWSMYQTPKSSPDADRKKEKQSMESVTSMFKSWQTIASAMTTPETMASLLNGAGTMPEMYGQFSQAVMGSMAELQKKMGESVARMGKSVEGYGFEHLDENLLHVWTQIYEKEFQKFFYMPQLGLTREYQERVNHMMDTFHLFQTNLAEFLRLLFMPFQRSIEMMNEELAEKAQKGELPDNSQAYYQMWIKTLEGHFMTLFQTPEYITALTNTISALSRFSRAKDAVFEDMIQGLPIAQQSELDDLAKQVHDLKKRIQILEHKIQD